jgi:hypothetical protein
MSKTTALTFTTAIILFAACMAISLHGQRIAENRMYAGNEQFAIYDGDIDLNSWERAAGLTGLLAFSVTIAGAMLWSGEIYPRAQKVSVLGLERREGRRIIRPPAHLNSATAAEIHLGESCARLHEEENLAPLERVIRGC